jgi:hypothetical protein
VGEAQPLEGVGIVATIAGTGEAALGADGVRATESDLNLPLDAAVAPDGLLYLVDWNNHRVVVVEDGILRTVAGSSMLGPTIDGRALEAGLIHPTHISFAGSRMFVSAWHNAKVGAVDLSTGEMSTVVGTGERSFAGDGGPARDAALDLPVATAFDGEGRLLVMDQGNQRLRRVEHDGTIDTIIGPEELALFYETPQLPAGRMEIGADGILYIADGGNFRILAADVDAPEPSVWTIAGETTEHCERDWCRTEGVTFRRPIDLAIAETGEIYVADGDEHCIKKIDLDGAIYPIAGRCGERGYEGDGGPANHALFNRPYGIALHGNVLYIADTANHVVRRVSL